VLCARRTTHLDYTNTQSLYTEILISITSLLQLIAIGNTT